MVDLIPLCTYKQKLDHFIIKNAQYEDGGLKGILTQNDSTVNL